MIHITPPIPPSGPRFLPAVAQGFVIGDHEPLSVGLRRLTVEQFDVAIAHLTDPEDLNLAIHGVRKSSKRIRSVLRLIRDDSGGRSVPGGKRSASRHVTGPWAGARRSGYVGHGRVDSATV